MQIDLTDVDAGGGGGEYEEGMYSARVVDVSHETSNSSGKPYINWEFKITSGSQEGRHVWHNTSLQQQALFAVKQVLQALFPGKDLDKEFDTADIAEEALGKEVRIYIVPDEYNGNPTANVERILPPEGDEEESESASSDEEETVSEEEEIPF